MKIKHLIEYILASCILLCSCSSIKASKASKRLIIPGIPTVKKYTTYSFTINAKHDFKVKSIYIKTTDKETSQISSFDFINLSNNKGHRVTNFDKTFNPGNYSFSIISKDIDLVKENVELNVFSNNKSQKIEIKIRDFKKQVIK